MTEAARRKAICTIAGQVNEAVRRQAIRTVVGELARRKTICALVETVRQRAEARLPRPTHYSNTLH